MCALLLLLLLLLTFYSTAKQSYKYTDRKYDLAILCL